MSVSFAMIGIFFPLTIFLQSILGLSPLHAALVNLPGSLVSGIVAPLAGRLSDRVPAKWVVATGFGVLAVAIGWLAAVVEPGVSVVTIVLPMTLFGVGTGASSRRSRTSRRRASTTAPRAPARARSTRRARWVA